MPNHSNPIERRGDGLPKSVRQKFSLKLGIYCLLSSLALLIWLIFPVGELYTKDVGPKMLGVALTISVGLGLGSLLNAFMPANVAADVKGNLPFSDMQFRVFGMGEILVTFGCMATVGLLIFGIAFPNETERGLAKITGKLESVEKVLGISSNGKENPILESIKENSEEIMKSVKSIERDDTFLRRLRFEETKLSGQLKPCDGDITDKKLIWVFIDKQTDKFAIVEKNGDTFDSWEGVTDLLGRMKLLLVRNCDLENYKNDPERFKGKDSLALISIEFSRGSSRKINTIVKTTKNFRQGFVHNDGDLALMMSSRKVLQDPKFWRLHLTNFDISQLSGSTALELANAFGFDRPDYLCQALSALGPYKPDEMPPICSKIVRFGGETVTTNPTNLSLTGAFEAVDDKKPANSIPSQSNLRGKLEP